MPEKNNLSACILVLNGEKTIGKTLDSVKKFADEIVVGIDSLTIDRTKDICQKYTDKIFEVKHRDNFDLLKNKVIEKAGNDWILWLDADEHLDEKLGTEILETIKYSKFDAYKVPRKNIVFGKWIEHTGWYPDHQIRLFKKDKTKFVASKLHQHPQVNGQVSELKNHIIHQNYQSISQFIQRMDQYTNSDAKNFEKEIKVSDFVTIPVNEFLKRFLKHKGFRDGLHGLALSILQASYEFIVLCKVWEKQGFKPETTDIKQVKKAVNKAVSDFSWWEKELLIKKGGNKIRKTYFKILRKLKL